MNALRGKTWVFFVGGLVLLSVIGGLWLSTSTPYGMGLVNDSAVYVSGARNLLAGKGYMRLSGDLGLKPITHFPPLFSLTLMLAALVSRSDPLVAVRGLMPMLFGLNIFLLGGWVRLLGRRQDLALLAAALWAFSDWGLNLHAYVLSEPLFLTFFLLAFIIWAIYQDQPRPYWAGLNGLLASLAYLTRYAGATLLVTFGLLLLGYAWREQRRRKDLQRWLIGALPLPALWTFYTWRVDTALGNRQVAWHPIALETLRYGLQNSLNALAPDWLIRLFPPLGSLFSALGLLASLALVVGIGVGMWRMGRQPKAALPRWLAPVLFGGIYWGFLIASISLLDASTPLDDRILAPLYLTLLALSMVALGWLLQRPARGVRLAALVGIGVGLPLLVWDGVVQGQTLRQEGLGLAHREIQTTRLWDLLRQYPAGKYVYSDRPAAIHLYVERPCLPLPTPMNPVQARLRPDYAEDLAEMKTRIRAGQAILVLFDLHRHGDPAYLSEVTAGLGEPRVVDFVWVYGTMR
ncbi:phospholipid carrier-dependent glycosyltransferase [uncultured Thermanaerothrix sp.]|uniref:phospholipid carrier-dependent glycosyltransferase n=1 Tax=uncultured Thermanaerothrix sp. TaxID=1195149 RepID=UPI002602C9AA|nr:phospholipid carrier-dependent glycosyltransferase [uncultured Thermanaerothrix sp.]